MTNDVYKVGIVIVSWNTIDALRICLASVFEKITDLTLQIIVVDNASSDNSAAMVDAEFPLVELVRNTKNVGFGAAVNQVVGLLKAQYVFLLNSDTRIIGEDLSSLVRIMDEDHSIGVASGKMCNMEGEPMPSYYAFPTFWYLVRMNTINLVRKFGKGARGRVRKCIGRDGVELCEVDWVSGGFLLLRRELIGNALIFDPRLFMYYEDALLCRKIWNMGYKVVYIPMVEVHHEQGGSSKKRLTKSLLASFESSRVYVQEVYGEKVLTIYDRIVRTSWKLIRLFMHVLYYTGFQDSALRKIEQFGFLLANTDSR